MSGNVSFGTFAVVNEGCPITHSVGGSNSANFVLGELPSALEVEFDYPSMRALAKASADALAQMRAKYVERYGEQPDDEDDGGREEQPA